MRLHPRELAAPAAHLPASHVERVGFGARPQSRPVAGNHQQERAVPESAVLRGAADGVPGVAGAGVRGEESPGAAAHSPAGAAESGAPDAGAGTTREISGFGSVGCESRSVGRDFSLRVEVVAEQREGVETIVGVHLGENLGCG